MKPLRVFSVVALLGFLFFSSSVFAVIDNNASAVQLRTSCTEAGVALNNCFTTMNSLVTWISNTRQPSANNSLVVNIGPGIFGAFTCTNGGYTSLRGSGREATVIRGVAFNMAINVSNCTGMEFSNLKVEGTRYGYITWSGGGTSVWNQVDVLGHARAWDEQSCAAVRGTHYWFGSRVASHDAFSINATYNASCDESWFFGSEIRSYNDGLYDNDTINYAANTPMALNASGVGEIHVYGSVVRVDATRAQAVSGTMVAANVLSGGKIHLHGTGIDVLSAANHKISVLVAASNGSIHANVSAYNLKSGGIIERIANNGGHVHAPYLWEEHPTPPNILSQDGADVAVVTTPGGTPRMVIYSTACPSKWFDVGANACRP